MIQFGIELVGWMVLDIFVVPKQLSGMNFQRCLRVSGLLVQDLTMTAFKSCFEAACHTTQWKVGKMAQFHAIPI